MLYLRPLLAHGRKQAAGGHGSGWCWDRGGVEGVVQSLGGSRRTATVGMLRPGWLGGGRASFLSWAG